MVETLFRLYYFLDFKVLNMNMTINYNYIYGTFIDAFLI